MRVSSLDRSAHRAPDGAAVRYDKLLLLPDRPHGAHNTPDPPPASTTCAATTTPWHWNLVLRRGLPAVVRRLDRLGCGRQCVGSASTSPSSRPPHNRCWPRSGKRLAKCLPTHTRSRGGLTVARPARRDHRSRRQGDRLMRRVDGCRRRRAKRCGRVRTRPTGRVGDSEGGVLLRLRTA